MYETSDSNGENNEDDSWESNIMLKDNRWSMSKGEKNKSDDNCLLTTPIIIRHNYSNKNKNLLPNTKPLPPPLNLTDDEFNESMEGLEDGQIGSSKLSSVIDGDIESNPCKVPNTSNKCLKNNITVECTNQQTGLCRTKC